MQDDEASVITDYSEVPPLLTSDSDMDIKGKFFSDDSETEGLYQDPMVHAREEAESVSFMPPPSTCSDSMPGSIFSM